MRTARRAAYAIWLAALFACPASATAASVAVETRCDKYGCHERLAYSAVRGEVNDVTVAQERDLVTIRDSAGIQPGTACEAVDPVTARCALVQSVFLRSAQFYLRDKSDRLDARALAIDGALLDGGRGNDRLDGPDAAAASFVGGPGNDEMVGGTRPDRFDSKRRDGSDTLVGGPPPPLATNYIPAYDEVFYTRSRSVRVELDGRRNDGERGERDNVIGIEGLWTGAGNDVVVGTDGQEFMWGGAGRDLLRGGGGADRLVGGDRLVIRRDIPIGSADRLEGGAGPDSLDGQGGRDLLVGGSGRDQLDGGRGSDRIRSGDPDRDWVLCGRGLDRLAASATDVLTRGCERQHGAVSPSEAIVNWRFSVAVTSLIVACPVAAPQACEGTLTLSPTGHPQATSNYSITPGMAADVALPLDAQDFDAAAAQMNGAVATTANDSARFGELPDQPTDSWLDALGVPHL